jgi:hypothetical protein
MRVNERRVADKHLAAAARAFSATGAVDDRPQAFTFRAGVESLVIP